MPRLTVAPVLGIIGWHLKSNNMNCTSLPKYYDGAQEAKEVASNLLYLLERSGIPLADDVRKMMLDEIRLIQAVCL